MNTPHKRILKPMTSLRHQMQHHQSQASPKSHKDNSRFNRALRFSQTELISSRTRTTHRDIYKVDVWPEDNHLTSVRTLRQEENSGHSILKCLNIVGCLFETYQSFDLKQSNKQTLDLQEQTQPELPQIEKIGPYEVPILKIKTRINFCLLNQPLSLPLKGRIPTERSSRKNLSNSQKHLDVRSTIMGVHSRTTSRVKQQQKKPSQRSRPSLVRLRTDPEEETEMPAITFYRQKLIKMDQQKALQEIRIAEKMNRRSLQKQKGVNEEVQESRVVFDYNGKLISVGKEVTKKKQLQPKLVCATALEKSEQTEIRPIKTPKVVQVSKANCIDEPELQTQIGWARSPEYKFKTKTFESEWNSAQKQHTRLIPIQIAGSSKHIRSSAHFIS